MHKVIFSLKNQTLPADKIVLYLSEEEFPQKEKHLPDNLLAYTTSGDFEIRWVQKNIRSYAKLVPALKDFPNDVIITVDDDIFYPENLFELLYDAYLQQPQYIHCHRGHFITFEPSGKIKPYSQLLKKTKYCSTPTFRTLFTGVGGVLYPPNCLHEDACDIDAFLKIAPTTDDLWFWAMAILKGTKIHKLKNCIMNKRIEIHNEGSPTLISNNKRTGNDVALSKILNKYPSVLEKLHQEK